MSDTFVKAVPKTAGELKTNLAALFQNKSHVKGVMVNPGTQHIEVRLDGMAHFAGKHDFFMPIRKGKTPEASQLITKLLHEIDQGFPPSDADATALFDLIDPVGA